MGPKLHQYFLQRILGFFAVAKKQLGQPKKAALRREDELGKRFEFHFKSIDERAEKTLQILGNFF